jgi:aspartyl-tRNA(Asn)/glutamyl-tRNA(Gln) amidotransferase subunit C
MKLSEKDVLFLANLAHLNLSKDEVSNLLEDLQEVTSYFEHLENVQTIQIDCPFPLNSKNFFENKADLRDDEECLETQISSKEFLTQSPRSDGGYLIVPKVLEE